MPKMGIVNTRLLPGRCRARQLFQGLLVLTFLAASMVLAGCGDDDDSFEGADVVELQNTSWEFGPLPTSDLSAFNLESRTGTLTIGSFGSGVLSDDEANFTLEVDETTPDAGNAFVVNGSVDLDEGDNPIGQDFSRCTFEVDTVDPITALPPEATGLTPGDTNPMECLVSDDNSRLDLENSRSGRQSTGTLAMP
jgi:hypothetical protein